MAAGFWLIELLGIRGTTWVGVALNVVAASLALWFGRTRTICQGRQPPELPEVAAAVEAKQPERNIQQATARTRCCRGGALGIRRSRVRGHVDAADRAQSSGPPRMRSPPWRLIHHRHRARVEPRRSPRATELSRRVLAGCHARRDVCEHDPLPHGSPHLTCRWLSRATLRPIRTSVRCSSVRPSRSCSCCCRRAFLWAPRSRWRSQRRRPAPIRPHGRRPTSIRRTHSVRSPEPLPPASCSLPIASVGGRDVSNASLRTVPASRSSSAQV